MKPRKTEPKASRARQRPRKHNKLAAKGRALKPGLRVHPRRKTLPGPQPDIESGPGRAGTTGGNLLLKGAGRFHGHIGPFLALGMKMGLLANEVIGRDPFGVVTSVTVEIRPPRGCLVDGLQYATGCTMGKGNIRIVSHPTEIRALFRRGSREITVAVRDDLVARIENALAGMNDKAIVDYAFRIMDTPAGDLFEVT